MIQFKLPEIGCAMLDAFFFPFVIFPRTAVGHWKSFSVAVFYFFLTGSVTEGQELLIDGAEKTQKTPFGSEPGQRVQPGPDVLTGMAATSQAFRNAVKAVEPALVTIESFGGVSTVQGRIGGIRKQGEGATTGLLISSDGYLLTSTFNFVQRQPVISVITNDGVRRVAKIVGKDETRKICLLKIDGVTDLPTPEFAKLDDLKVGQWTLSVGVGYGDISPAISKGILSAKNRIGGRAIQTDARISPANYGGPLVDIKGRVIGICVPLDPQSAAVGAGVEWYDSGIGFAIPLDGAEQWINRLKAGETLSPAFLGIKAKPNPTGKGIWIEEVIPRSPAKDSNLLSGDVIVSLKGKEVNDMMALRQILNRCEAGQEIELLVFKEDQQTPIKVTLRLSAPPLPKEGSDPLEPPEIR
jgi:serine protease Do